DYYYDMLLSFGDQCECLEPRHVREEMKRRIQRLSALYEDQNRVIG
ncbi:MAG: WYL domain-containing protein, partial [Oscillospiraceae bacterium]|nr:WYL domain-containing protein [Oscillospiraceae bacterium]